MIILLFIVLISENEFLASSTPEYYDLKKLTKMSINFTIWDALEGSGSLSAKTNWFAKADCFHYKASVDQALIVSN